MIDRSSRALRSRACAQRARTLRPVGRTEVVNLQHIPFSGCVDLYAVISWRNVARALDRRGQFRVSRSRKTDLPVRVRFGSTNACSRLLAIVYVGDRFL